MTVVVGLCAHPLIQHLTNLALDTRDYVVFGSAPMFAHGLTDTIHDLDIVARGKVLRLAKTLGRPARGTVTGDPLWRSGAIQFSARWISPEWDTDELIARAEFIDGIPFAPLADVLRYKQILRRDKDFEDIATLTEWLSRAQ